MLDITDIVLRTVAVMAAALFAGLLLVTGRHQRITIPGGLLCAAIAAFFVTSAPGSSAAFGAWNYPLTALCVTKAVWFWLFARALFHDNAHLDRYHVAIAIVVAIVGTWQQTVFLSDYRSGSASTWDTLAGFGFDGVLLVLIVLGLFAAWRDLATDLVEQRRHLRLGFIAATGSYLLITLAVQIHNLLLNVPTPGVLSRANMVLVAIGCLTAGGFLLQPRSQSWLDPTRTSNIIALSHSESNILVALQRMLDRERIHRQEGLTIGSLAEKLGSSEHVLRRVINRGMGFRNFNDFLHAWRIREACEELARPEQARLPVLSIAMKVGYGSVGVFNRAFKARIGMTPTDYRRRTLNDASQSP